MPLRESKGNMYSFVTHTWGPIKGLCEHSCEYCYMKQFKQNPVRLDEKELKTNLGSGNFIFVGSGTDMFANNVPEEWIRKVFLHCGGFWKNKYLFQSKNTRRFNDYNILHNFPADTVLGTTIETDDCGLLKKISNTPGPFSRAKHLSMFLDHERMVTIEPVLQFNLENLIQIIRVAEPAWVNIGADSKHHNLPEPSWEKVQALIAELGKFTEVRQKSNLERLKKQPAD